MEQISQFENNSDTGFQEEQEEYKAQVVGRNSHLQGYQVQASGNSVSFGSRNNSSVKKKSMMMQNNFMQPSP